jgi:hypothetical protein
MRWELVAGKIGMAVALNLHLSCGCHILFSWIKTPVPPLSSSSLPIGEHAEDSTAPPLGSFACVGLHGRWMEEIQGEADVAVVNHMCIAAPRRCDRRGQLARISPLGHGQRFPCCRSGAKSDLGASSYPVSLIRRQGGARVSSVGWQFLAVAIGPPQTASAPWPVLDTAPASVRIPFPPALSPFIHVARLGWSVGARVSGDAAHRRLLRRGAEGAAMPWYWSVRKRAAGR